MVIPCRLNFICQHFGKLCLFHLHVGVFIREKICLDKYPNILNPSYSSYVPAYEDGTDRVFRNVGIWNSDGRELPRRKKTTFRTRGKFGIKNCDIYLCIGWLSEKQTTWLFLQIAPVLLYYCQIIPHITNFNLNNYYFIHPTHYLRSELYADMIGGKIGNIYLHVSINFLSILFVPRSTSDI